jgi:hypothetical protein
MRTEEGDETAESSWIGASCDYDGCFGINDETLHQALRTEEQTNCPGARTLAMSGACGNGIFVRYRSDVRRVLRAGGLPAPIRITWGFSGGGLDGHRSRITL